MGKWQKSLQCSNCHQYVYLTKKSVRVYYFVWFKMVQKFWGWITTRQRGQQPSSDVMRLSGSVCMDSYTGCPVPKIASLHSLCQLRQTKRNGSFSLTHSSEKRSEVLQKFWNLHSKYWKKFSGFVHSNEVSFFSGKHPVIQRNFLEALTWNEISVTQ